MNGELYPGEFEAMEHNGRLDALEREEISREEIAALLARGSEEMTREPREDAISRQEALNCFKINNSKSDVWYALKELPPVTLKQRTGHWILVSDKTPGGYWKCSECLMHKRMPSGRLDSFCSCCGADMREREG